MCKPDGTEQLEIVTKMREQGYPDKVIRNVLGVYC